MAAGKLAQQAVRGSLYALTASGVTLILGLVRSIWLARLVAPEAFGVLALALFYIGLVLQLRVLGLDAALIHRQDPEGSFLQTYFSLRLGLDLLALGVLFACTPWIQRAYPNMQGLGQILPLLIAAHLLANASQVQETILRKRLSFRRLAWMDMISGLGMTIVAIYLASRGWGLWALVAERVTGFVLRFVLSWGPFRCWAPRLGWNAAHVRWFWAYGRPTWVASNLGYLLDRFDDFWVGTTLGELSLGYYAKSYEFARYPRRILANPLVIVLGPVFAALQGDRRRLSQLFYRSAHLILRTSFFVAGAFALALPELVHWVIGAEWWPMLWTFRLMALYVALDSVLLLISNLMTSLGRPDQLQRAHLLQALVFVPTVILGSRLWGRNGVALAADLMLLVGLWRLTASLRESVDLSLGRLWLRPSLALIMAGLAGYGVETRLPLGVWSTLAFKLAAFGAVFVGLLLALEGRDDLRAARWLWRFVRQGRSTTT
ncbi:MAG: oligosaccharide flippase family protein [Anaerolineae bacterium]|nr:oligosaccharide flippase family protein [Anaerolineae bacterium]